MKRTPHGNSWKKQGKKCLNCHRTKLYMLGRCRDCHEKEQRKIQDRHRRIYGYGWSF